MLETILRILVLAGAVGAFLLARRGEGPNQQLQVGFFWWILAGTSVGAVLFQGAAAPFPWTGFAAHAGTVCLLGIVIQGTQQERARLDGTGAPFGPLTFWVMTGTYLLGAAAFGAAQLGEPAVAPETLGAMITLAVVSASTLLLLSRVALRVSQGQTLPWAAAGLVVTVAGGLAGLLGWPAS